MTQPPDAGLAPHLASGGAVSAGLVAATLLELAARLSGARTLDVAAWAAVLLVLVAAAAGRRLGLREGYLVAVSLGFSAAVWAFAPDPATALAEAMDQAAFLMAFIVLLGLLYEAAATSPSIEEVGRYLTRQPPGRRYYALNSGTAVMSILFNLGVASFLVPLVQRGIHAATPGDPLNAVRERRQLSAVLRGFAWAVIWSPTAMAPLIVAELLPEADRHRWILLGLGIFALMLLLGGVEDMLRFRGLRPSGLRVAAPFPTRAALLFLAACGWLMLLTFGLAWLTGDSVVFGLMLACPLMLVGWVAAQAGAGGAVAAVWTRLGAVSSRGLPASASVAVTLACSGFIGRAAAALIPVESAATFLRLDAMPDFVLLSLIPLALTFLSLFALSPIMTSVFFGSFFAGLPVLPADVTLIALSISCGWALAMTVSPFSTVVLVMSRVGDVPVTQLTWGWNRVFSLMAALALVPVFALLTGGR